MPRAEIDDATLHYKVRGDGPPLLGIMGFALDQRFWAGQIPTVTATHRFITFDHRGVGYSTGAPATSIDDMAADAIALLDHLEIESCVVMGASMGGAVAQRIAIDHPERVSALVLAITWGRPVEYSLRQYRLGQTIADAIGAEAVRSAGLIQMFTPRFFEVGAEVVDRWMAVLDGPGAPPPAGADVLRAHLQALEKHDVLEDLRAVAVPTLVVGGRLDLLAPYLAAEELAAAIPGARLETFETGHGLMIEEMDRFNEVLGDFLSGLRAGKVG